LASSISGREQVVCSFGCGNNVMVPIKIREIS
jgi:hypothetical protein